MLEYFVHLDADRPPKDLVVAVAEIPASVSRAVLSPDRLPAHWQRTPAPAALTEFGDAFVREGRSVALIVPSAVAPGESNWLLNPQHPGFSQVRLLPLERFVYDRRLF
jgi:RES domain-containing protein